MELKQRMSRIAETILLFLPEDFSTQSNIIKQLINVFRSKGVQDFNFPHMYLPEIIQLNGLNYFHESMAAIEFITVFTSAEFVIRHFYIKNHTLTHEQMLAWSLHKEPLVRRLASEGSRPFLPWGIGIPIIKQKPEDQIPILERLWNDPNEIVRRSVSNHLNDISKINPDLVRSFVNPKLGFSEKTDKDLKHALRTLLKKGDVQVLKTYDYNPKWKPEWISFDLDKKKIKIGEKVSFRFKIKNNKKETAKLRLEYKISFLLADGSYTKKVFQLGEITLTPSEEFEKSKSHSFVLITTRRYYAGKHSVILVVNGVELKQLDFVLA